MQCIENINLVHILEPNCEKFKARKPDKLGWDRSFSEDDSIDHIVLPSSRQDQPWCRVTYLILYLSIYWYISFIRYFP